MHWSDKYLKALANKKQLIGDKALRDVLLNQFNSYPVLQEVRFKGFTADILLIDTDNKTLVGIEVKSDRDTLYRLEEQLRGYLKYCNYVLVATTLSHKKEILKILNNPEFSNIGLLMYNMYNEGKRFQWLKDGHENEVNGVGCDWISKKHQLYQWLYLLEMIWGEQA